MTIHEYVHIRPRNLDIQAKVQQVLITFINIPELNWSINSTNRFFQSFDRNQNHF